MQSIKNNISVGIIGGAGYTGGELIRLLLNHPYVDIAFINSRHYAGQSISVAHEDLFGETDLNFSNETNHNVDVVFLCQGHGKSREVLENHTFGDYTKIIDLSNDFRLTQDADTQDRNFVYGLPELKKQEIASAMSIANPGCFATAIQLALLPLAKENLLTHDIHVNALTGSTGAGQAPSTTTHFSWRNNNISTYKAFNHQHLAEIKESLTSLQSGFCNRLNFVPVRGNFTRGIFATAYTICDLSLDAVTKLYTDYYEEAPFVHITTKPIDLKQVVNSNKCLLKIEKHDGQIFITSVIDNLVKGASGQAIQNMNLLFGFNETTGLKLKSVAF